MGEPTDRPGPGAFGPATPWPPSTQNPEPSVARRVLAQLGVAAAVATVVVGVTLAQRGAPSAGPLPTVETEPSPTVEQTQGCTPTSYTVPGRQGLASGAGLSPGDRQELVAWAHSQRGQIVNVVTETGDVYLVVDPDAPVTTASLVNHVRGLHADVPITVRRTCVPTNDLRQVARDVQNFMWPTAVRTLTTRLDPVNSRVDVITSSPGLADELLRRYGDRVSVTLDRTGRSAGADQSR